MACIINSGYALDCRDNIGGIQEVYIGNFDNNVTYTLGTNDIVEGFAGGTVSYYTFAQENEVGEFIETMNASTENGTVFFEQNLTLTFHRLNAELKNQLRLLAQGNLSVLILDQRGVYHLMGIQNGVRATEGTSGVGKAYGDLNGVTVTLQGKEPAPANEVDQVLTGLVIIPN